MYKNNKAVCLFMAIVMIISTINFTIFTSGAETYIHINNANDLKNLNSNISAAATQPVYVVFNVNVDASKISYTPVITDKRVIVYGQNHYIKNLKSSDHGLFRKVGSDSEFWNLGIINANITKLDASGEGYGILCSRPGTGTDISSCFVQGSIAVYAKSGSTCSDIGGLVGSFDGEMYKSFALVDIYTDGSNVGGLVGRYTGSADKISSCYSTGTIDNKSRKNIGGLVGLSDSSCLKDCYTTLQIKNTYADTVKSIGCVPDLNTSVFYDENISLQRQGDMDGAHRFSGTYNRLSANWTYESSYYPQLTDFYSNTNKVFQNISAISAAMVHVNNGCGREYVPVSTPTSYSTATITKTTAYANNNRIQWKITGGIDEYYYPGTSYTIDPGMVDGLSGNAFDSTNGKYIFTTSADVVFTASCGGFERDITVHATSDPNPYIAKGSGTSSDPFIISNAYELDMVRMYCIDDLTGAYYYKIVTPTTEYISTDGKNTKTFVYNPLDLSSYDSWNPIVGFKGTFNGNYSSSNTNSKLSVINLKISSPNGENTGLFANISGKATITDLFIEEAQIAVTKGTNAGILVGSVNANGSNVTIQKCIASGKISGTENVGTLIGYANNNLTVSRTVNFAIVNAVTNCGGIIGNAASSAVSVVDSYSTSVLLNATQCGGIYGSSSSANITSCLFTGNISTTGTKNGLSNGTTNISSSFYDRQAATIPDADTYGKKTEELLSAEAAASLGSNWSYNSNIKIYPYISGLHSEVRYCAFNAITYTKTDSGEANAENFTEATYVNGYHSKVESVSGYNNYSVSGNKITKKNGGGETYRVHNNYYNKSTGLTYDHTRYVYFGGIGLNFYFKIMLAGEVNEYKADMSNKLLFDLTTDDNSCYSMIINAESVGTYTTPISFTKSDKLIKTAKFGVEVPTSKYTYTVNAYSDKEETTPLTSNGSSYTIPSYEAQSVNVYIKITVTPKSIPWGIFNIDCY
ncbi:MAG: hypothetical protein IKU52_06905 [Clostridia bacterium]|nr:hypothetical protein [Clostridia bacterium]